jgi:CP family cyanate transporter-like MFS transporter
VFFGGRSLIEHHARLEGMSEHRRLPLWAGRTAALLGIVLVAFTLRQAVAAMSPILGDIRVDIPISNIGVGLLGTLPPILLAASGFIVHHLPRRSRDNAGRIDRGRGRCFG